MMDSTVRYDHRAIVINVKRRLLLSGAIHYPRSTPADWPFLLQHSKEAGLNCIETYVFWNLHEFRRGEYDFSDRLDLPRFCREVSAAGLHLILRIGPYICAETNYGGFPPWLRDVPGLRLRTWNEPFCREMERWVRHLVSRLDGQFHPNGPIILAQMENEYNNIAQNYGEDGARYLRWCGELGASLNLGIPWIMCEGGAAGCIETLNGFYVHDRLAEHRRRHPDQPALWTENWPGWYDTWGYPLHGRRAENVAYAVARFFAAGGTGVNYYMWHGGTNFGREAMFLQTTQYYNDAPLDEYGLPTAKAAHLGRLHRLLKDYADVLLVDQPPRHEPRSETTSVYVYGAGHRQLAFLCNDAPGASALLDYGGQRFELAPRSVVLLAERQVVYDSARREPGTAPRRRREPLAAALGDFVWAPEPLASRRADDLTMIELPTPAEQLQFTHDESDYCWYRTRFAVAPDAAGAGPLALTRVADLAMVFVDGVLVASTPGPLVEHRGAPDGDGYQQVFPLTLAPGEHRLEILCAAVGLIKGDWMLGGRNMVEERKGLWGPVCWRGAVLPGPWRVQPGLVGEKERWFAPDATATFWQPAWKLAERRPLCWWRTAFRRPLGGDPLAVDLGSMTKGLVWLNGRCAGRYWLIAATGSPEKWLNQAVENTGHGQPTQQFYHLPLAWLQDDNELVLFDEAGGNPASVRLCRWREM